MMSQNEVKKKVTKNEGKKTLKPPHPKAMGDLLQRLRSSKKDFYEVSCEAPSKVTIFTGFEKKELWNELTAVIGSNEMTSEGKKLKIKVEDTIDKLKLEALEMLSNEERKLNKIAGIF